MGKNDIRKIFLLSGIICLVMGIATLFVSIIGGTGKTWSTYLVVALNIGQIIGSILVFLVPSRISEENKKKYGNIFIVAASFCVLNDVLYKVPINTFCGIAFLVVATLVYRHKDSESTLQA